VSGEMCMHCRFWVDGEDGRVPFTDADAWGSCRRYPPVMEDRHDLHGLDHFPACKPDEWCGEFQRKSAGWPMEGQTT
jgi:hypothetical protein